MIALRGLNSELRPYAEWAHEIAEYYGISPTVTSVKRTWEEQQELYTAYVQGHSRYPAAKPGESAHQYGFAWDSWVRPDQMPMWTAIRRYVGFIVPAGDEVHGELPQWRSFLG